MKQAVELVSANFYLGGFNFWLMAQVFTGTAGVSPAMSAKREQ